MGGRRETHWLRFPEKRLFPFTQGAVGGKRAKAQMPPTLGAWDQYRSQV